MGATRRDILWLVLREGGALTAAGLSLGLVAAVTVTQSLRSILYDVSASDPATVAAAFAAISVATLAACYLPARRATRIDAARTLARE